MEAIENELVTTDPSRDRDTIWYAVRTNPRCEGRAAMGLRAKGMRAFVPEETVWRKRRRRTKAERVKRPLFVRYIFAGIDPRRHGCGHIRATDGVEYIVGIAGRPMQIPAAVISELMYASLHGQFDCTRKRPPFERGQQVRIAEGPFKDFLAKVKRADSGRRVEVLLEMLGRESTVIIEALHLRAA